MTRSQRPAARTKGAGLHPQAPDRHSPAEPDRRPNRQPLTRPTVSRVLAELPNHAWVHLACHGSQHPTDPTASAFRLADGPLSVTDLIQQDRPGPRELAFLSACQTATGSTRIPDESLHLAAAMQLMGYRHVIATLWSIYDSMAPGVAATVYGTLATCTLDADHAALALHHAVTVLRAKRPASPLAWAPYLHTGP
ncbi:MAG: CHAT domain-containing protein [Pseudonocardia sp.]